MRDLLHNVLHQGGMMFTSLCDVGQYIALQHDAVHRFRQKALSDHVVIYETDHEVSLAIFSV